MPDKITEEGDRLDRRTEGKPLASSDAQTVATPTAAEKQNAEADRTNQSSGSVAELALRSRGMSKEQIAQQLAAQGDSITLDYGNGVEVSRKTGLTSKDLENKFRADALKDDREIVPKPVEVGPAVIRTGLDYNVGNEPVSQKLLKFAGSAQARLLDPTARETYLQGFLDKVIGIGEGLNEAKNEIKTAFSGAASKAWTGLTDGSVAKFMAQPNAINEPLFRTIGNCLDVMSKDPNAVNKVLTVLGRELESANDRYTKMSPRERGIQDGKAMFFFINPSGSTEAADLALAAGERVLEPVDKALVETVKRSMDAAKELGKTSVEAAGETKKMLFDWLERNGIKGRQRQLAGIPDGYFEGIEPVPEQQGMADSMSAMSSLEDTQKYLDRMPIHKPGGKTSGILVAGDQEVGLISGKEGPAKAMPLGSKGYNGYTKTHAEGHAAAFMTINGLTQARLYINNSKICQSCEQNLSRMLASGSKLEVVLPDGTMRTFVGGAK